MAYTEPLGDVWKYDPDYNRAADFLGIDKNQREDVKIAKKISFLVDWAVNKKKTANTEDALWTLNDLRKKLGINTQGELMLGQLFEFVRLKQDRERKTPEVPYEQVINEMIQAKREASQKVEEESFKKLDSKINRQIESGLKQAEKLAEKTITQYQKSFKPVRQEKITVQAPIDHTPYSTTIMSTTHRGNLLNEVTFEEHDGTLNAKRVSIVGGDVTVNSNATVTLVSTPTLFAVVNTSAAGQSSVVLDSGKNFIGLATVNIGSSNATLFAVVNTAAAGQASVVLDNSIANIGFATVKIAAGPAFIGIVTVANASFPVTQSGTWDEVGINDSGNSITIDGNVGILGNVTISDSKGFIGLVTAVPSTTARTITGNLTLSDSKGFIGLVTAWNRNAGTTKTLVPLPVGLGNNSLATVAVPTNANKINLTQLILSSNVTTEIAIKSGVTYLTGNASLGVTLFPGGGFVMNGAPDSLAWIGLPSGAMVVEKRDAGGTVSKIAGNVIYFDE